MFTNVCEVWLKVVLNYPDVCPDPLRHFNIFFFFLKNSLFLEQTAQAGINMMKWYWRLFLRFEARPHPDIDPDPSRRLNTFVPFTPLCIQMWAVFYRFEPGGGVEEGWVVITWMPRWPAAPRPEEQTHLLQIYYISDSTIFIWPPVHPSLRVHNVCAHACVGTFIFDNFITIALHSRSSFFPISGRRTALETKGFKKKKKKTKVRKKLQIVERHQDFYFLMHLEIFKDWLDCLLKAWQ